MNTKIRDYLGIALIIATLAFGYAVVSYTLTYSNAVGLSARSFTVEGSGKVAVVPDIAQFTFGVTTEGGEDLSNLQNENATRINRVIDFLKDNGIDEEDIKTQRLNISPRYQRFNCFNEVGPCPPPKIVGYTIVQSVQVKVRDLDRVGGIFAGVVDNGANTASNLSFTIDDTSGPENEARAEAIEEAQRKAKSTAKAAGVRLGRLLSIDEFSSQPQYGFGVDSLELRSAVAPSIEPGTQDVSVSVILRYEIK